MDSGRATSIWGIVAVAMMAALVLPACQSSQPATSDAGENVAATTPKRAAIEETTGNPAGGESGKATPAATSAARPANDIATPIRVSGDTTLATQFIDGEWVSGNCRIETPLPVGYPAPTPPGAIEIKKYPSVRRAEFSGTLPPDVGMNAGFFPLFNHISRREIAMTSPVEMDYAGLGVTKAQANDDQARWTMSFVYRTADQGATGTDEQDQSVRIVDTKPVTVVAIGVMGPYQMARVEESLTQLESWLQSQTQWDAAGDARALYYNGPDTPNALLWWEVQLPVRPMRTPSTN